MDVTQHSDNELSQLVFNDEGLYLIRHDSDFLSDMVTFTDAQLAVLVTDLAEDEA